MFQIVIFAILFINTVHCFRCDRRPYGSTTQASPSDGRFKLVVLGNENNAYIPDQLYTVQITQTDEYSRFTGFMISAEGDTKPDPRNPRRTITLFPGELRPQTSITAKFSDRCLYSVEQTSISLKNSVEVYWQAPPSNQGCVTLRAMVIENDASWFEDGAPLTRKLCEDMRQPDDVTPQLNYECDICDEAKYELSFTGIWSRNTHPRLYPENDWTARYSDLVGASHAADFILWAPGTIATQGFQELAEHANTTNLEAEIREKIGAGVRTVIKGKGHGYQEMSNPTYAFFRTDRYNHVFTAAVGLHPSPDWFLGVTRFELCQEDNTWLPERELNLYPWDAGTDSGVSYESPNIATFPQGAVSRVQMSSYDKNSPFYEMDMKDMHPFGKLHIKLIRTYHRNCEEPTEIIEETTVGGQEEEKEETTTIEVTSTVEPEEVSEEISEEISGELPEVTPVEPKNPSRYHIPELASSDSGGERPTVTEAEPAPDCPMSNWEDWSPCDGECIDGEIHGFRWRERFHLVDGEAVEKFDPHEKRRKTHKKEVPKYCKTHFEDFERIECVETCSENEVPVQRRIMPLTPGSDWYPRRHG